MQLTGIIRDIFHPETYGNFKKRVFWLTQLNAERPNTWQLEMQGEDCALLDKYATGQVVECHIEILGKLSPKGDQERVFNTLKCIYIKKLKTI